jgi:hypothetical protein
MTKAEEVFTKVEQLVAGGMTKAEAFKQLASEYGQPVNSMRGAYYAHAKGSSGPGKPRRRETTPEDALADARAALERALATIDREVEAARVRAEEAAAEHKALKASADARKAEISKRLEALR